MTAPLAAAVFIRRGQVQQITGLPRSTLYQLIARGDFPPPVHLGPKTTAWIEAEVQAWMAARIAARDARRAA